LKLGLDPYFGCHSGSQCHQGVLHHTNVMGCGSRNQKIKTWIPATAGNDEMAETKIIA